MMLRMNHTQWKINCAQEYFEDYLTKEELQDEQYYGRFWDIICLHLFILVDEDTLLVVDCKGDTAIYGREYLPLSLRGRHYYE